MSRPATAAPTASGFTLRLLALAFVVALHFLVTGCASVSAYQRERLTDRIMSFDAEARMDARLTKSLEAREGSTGGNGGAGGGCACN
jgi:predicted secreted protein